MEKVSKNVLGGNDVKGLVIEPTKTMTSTNQYDLYKELFKNEIPEATFDLDRYDREIYTELKNQGYDLIKYTEPLVGKGTENVILDQGIIKKSVDL